MTYNTSELTNHAENENKYYIECISLIGTKMYFTIHMFLIFLKQIDIWVIFLSFVILMSIFDPTDILQRGGYSAVIYTWFCIAAIYMGLTVLMLISWYFFLKNKHIKSVIIPINSFVIVCTLFFLYPYIEMPVLGDRATLPSAVHIKDSLYFFAIEQVFITLYVSIGFPLTVRNLGLEDAFPGRYFTAKPKIFQPTEYVPVQQKTPTSVSQPSTPSLIQIGTQSFNVRDIRYISAEEHYVRVKTVSKQWLIRDKFSQVITRFQNQIGFQVHRSHWVAFSHVKEVTKSEKQYKIQLHSGELIPISNARRQKFQENLVLYQT